MKSKLWIALILSFSVIMISSLLAFSFIQNNTQLNLPDPDTIKIYKNSQIELTSFNAENNNYKLIVDSYNNMSQKTLLEQILAGKIISDEIEEGINCSVWEESYKENGTWVEFVYNNAKKMIISVNGSTRRVDVKGIIFPVNKEDKFSNLTIFYREAESYSATDQYGENMFPLIIEANTYEIYKIIKEMN